MANELFTADVLEVEKIKTPFARMIARKSGITDEMYYEIMYYDPKDKEIHIGCGSYNPDFVQEWLDGYFEVVREQKYSLALIPWCNMTCAADRMENLLKELEVAYRSYQYLEANCQKKIDKLNDDLADAVREKNAFENLAREQSKHIGKLINDNEEAIQVAIGWKEIVEMHDKHPWKHLLECLLRRKEVN